MGLAGSQRAVTTASATVKLYPFGAERRSLIGWQIMQAEGRVPPELAQTRCVRRRDHRERPDPAAVILVRAGETAPGRPASAGWQ
jgi:hypothetical protein